VNSVKKTILIILTALAVSGSAQAASPDVGTINAIIKNLNLTSFPNSVGPRRLPGRTSFADYGFVIVEKSANGASIFSKDKGWVMSFRVLSTGPRSLQLCFHDRGLARPGDATVPSYNATSALVVSKLPHGLWTAKQVRAGFANCKNDPTAV
jgi:hypothetical protein